MIYLLTIIIILRPSNLAASHLRLPSAHRPRRHDLLPRANAGHPRAAGVEVSRNRCLGSHDGRREKGGLDDQDVRAEWSYCRVGAVPSVFG